MSFIVFLIGRYIPWERKYLPNLAAIFSLRENFGERVFHFGRDMVNIVGLKARSFVQESGLATTTFVGYINRDRILTMWAKVYSMEEKSSTTKRRSLLSNVKSAGRCLRVDAIALMTLACVNSVVAET